MMVVSRDATWSRGSLVGRQLHLLARDHQNRLHFDDYIDESPSDGATFVLCQHKHQLDKSHSPKHETSAVRFGFPFPYVLDRMCSRAAKQNPSL